MIKVKINKEFPHHNIIKQVGNLYVVDYTNQTKNLPQKRSVEIHTTKPISIDSFFVENSINLEVGSVIYDNNSFKDLNGNAKSQCEVCIFPYQSKADSWILFAELKYTTQAVNNHYDFKKAIKQLYKTRYYYLDKNIFDRTKNTCYLVVSLPKQGEPFPNFILTPSRVADLKIKHNIILKASNSVKVINDKSLL